MGKHLKYIWHTLKHKYYVFQECRKLGIAWRGLMHDISKFQPCEWLPYAERSYNKYHLNQAVDEDFKLAFIHHLRNNKHHWQYWLMVNNGLTDERFVEVVSDYEVKQVEGEVSSGFTQRLVKKHCCVSVYPIPMPEEYAKEMVADWIGAGKALLGKKANTRDWYLLHKDNMIIHPETKAYVEKLLGFIAE